MTKKIQLLRGTTAQNDAFTGSSGELTVDTTLNELRVHDGSTVGGHKIGAADNSTITKNTSDQLQAVATVNANTAAGATNPIYDWVGTLAEYTSQAVATNHPDWICYITDDISGGGSVYTKAETDSLLANKVSIGHEVIAFQAPTAGNNYTWYRKYADGWVEQGGISQSGSTVQSISLPVSMADTNYTIQVTGVSASSDNTVVIVGFENVQVASFKTRAIAISSVTSYMSADASRRRWFVCGMAA